MYCKKWCAFGLFDVIAVWEVQTKADKIVNVEILYSPWVNFDVDNEFSAFTER